MGRTIDTVWVCRLCGQLDPLDLTDSSAKRCLSCGMFSGLATVSRSEAEQISRQHRMGKRRRRLLQLLLVVGIIGGLGLFTLQFFIHLGPKPPAATTRLSPSTASHTWAQARRTPQNVGFTPDSAPFPHRVSWTYRTPKPLHAAPAVVDDHLYLTTEDGRAIALNRYTGQPIWSYPTGGISSSTPAVAGEWVIIATRSGLLTALNRQNGDVIWTTDLHKPLLALTSPLVADGSLYIGAEDRHLHALDVATGQTRWTTPTQHWIISTAAYTETEQHVIVASQDTLLYVIDAHTGRPRFTYPTGRGQHAGTSPAVQGNRVYTGSSGGRVSALTWQNTTYPLESYIRLWKSRLFIWGMLKSPPEQKGRVWSTRLGGDVIHAPAIAHQTVYVAALQGQVAALDIETGAIRWMIKLETELTAAPTVAGNTILIGTKDGLVVALDTQTGDQQWDFQTEGPITGSPIVVGNMMYIVSHDGGLYALTGSETPNR